MPVLLERGTGLEVDMGHPRDSDADTFCVPAATGKVHDDPPTWRASGNEMAPCSLHPVTRTNGRRGRGRPSYDRDTGIEGT
jgi:hypothetical protein